MGMIGDWVLKTACEQAAQLPEGLVMAINASPVQFKNGLFAQSVESALERAGIRGERIEIEITEGLLLKNEAVVVAALHSLHRMGVRLAMDDFGTGYSSLGQLAKLPFDKIKIDRSLVGGTAKERAIVRAIATLGEGIGMATLAEGIETQGAARPRRGGRLQRGAGIPVWEGGTAGSSGRHRAAIWLEREQSVSGEGLGT